MWPMIAEPGLCCAECKHAIQPGRLCLSELPEETPDGVSRCDFDNYCIGCPQCWAQGKYACYVRHLDSGANTGNPPVACPAPAADGASEPGKRPVLKSTMTGQAKPQTAIAVY